MSNRVTWLRPTGLGLIILALLWSSFRSSSWARDARQPSSAEIVRQLTSTAKPEILTRGFGKRGVTVEGRAEFVPPPPSLDLEVIFEYASAELTPDARIVLDNLGRALNDPALHNSTMRIVGHTDAKGSDEFNLVLSRQRAQAVADYLARLHGMKPSRLQVEGYGRSQLIDPAHPESAVNRRVQVVNLGH